MTNMLQKVVIEAERLKRQRATRDGAVHPRETTARGLWPMASTAGPMAYIGPYTGHGRAWPALGIAEVNGVPSAWPTDGRTAVPFDRAPRLAHERLGGWNSGRDSHERAITSMS